MIVGGCVGHCFREVCCYKLGRYFSYSNCLGFFTCLLSSHFIADYMVLVFPIVECRTVVFKYLQSVLRRWIFVSFEVDHRRLSFSLGHRGSFCRLYTSQNDGIRFLHSVDVVSGNCCTLTYLMLVGFGVPISFRFMKF